jgi:MYXO-CTERM domain-containing protein
VRPPGEASGFAVRLGATAADGTVHVVIEGPPAPPPDAGAARDAGMVADAGRPARDAAVQHDDDGAALAGGCATGGTGAVGWLGLLALLAAFRARTSPRTSAASSCR